MHAPLGTGMTSQNSQENCGGFIIFHQALLCHPQINSTRARTASLTTPHLAELVEQEDAAPLRLPDGLHDPGPAAELELLHEHAVLARHDKRLREEVVLRGLGRPVLALQLSLGALQILDQQVLACELVVVWEVVDALPVGEVQLVQLVVDPPAQPRIRQEVDELPLCSRAVRRAPGGGGSACAATQMWRPVHAARAARTCGVAM
eukprot:350065-Chlamydomonas_euryale.AAC.2